MADELPQRRPFHESVVDAIGCVRNSGELWVLVGLIKETWIPKGHDEIIAAWNQRIQAWREQGRLLEADYLDSLGVVADLLEQKREAREKAKHEKEAKWDASKAVRIGTYLLKSPEFTDEDLSRIWDALPGLARVELQTEVAADLVAKRRARAGKKTVSS